MRRPAKLPIALALALGLTACMEPEPQTPATTDSVSAVIDLSEQTITVTRLKADERTRETHVWPVSTGRAGFETPTGAFRPFFLSRNHRSSLYDDAPMPWSVFFNGDIAVHGTTEIAHLGRPASHGCVRVHPAHAEILFREVLAVGKANTTISVVP